MSDLGEWVDTETVRFVRDLPGPIETVWAFLTNGEKRAVWFAGGAWELKPGGRAELIFENDELSPDEDGPPEKYKDLSGTQRYEGRILEVDPPHRLILQWIEREGEPSIVTFELAPHGDQVRLTLTHTGLVSESARISTGAGWHTHLDIWMAMARGEAGPSFWATHERWEAEYSALIAQKID